MHGLRSALRGVIGPDAQAGDAGLPLHDAAATRVLEASAAASLAPQALMQRAGLAVARLALAVAPHARRVWVACGPGNNGGDGLEAAAHLHRAGRQVMVALQAGASLPPDAAAALARARSDGVPMTDRPTPDWALAPDDLCIDALFGIGLRRAPAGWALDAIAALRAAAAPTLAIDLPSGLDADHGTAFDPAAVIAARWTLSLLTLKPGLFTSEGRDHAGDVWFDDLGVPNEAGQASARLLTGALADWPSRRHAQHKGSFGDVWVVGGAAGMVGAATLAARAALAAGAGRTYLVALDSGSLAIDPLHPELMCRGPQDLQSPATPLETATVACGCGGGEAVRAVLPGLIARSGRLLLDADALNAVAADAGLRTQLIARAARGRPTVLTPHPLEAARLLGVDAATVQADRLGAARRLADDLHAEVVLKGSGSVIAAPGALPWINASGNAALATAGSGDVLAGWLAGLWSQGLDAAKAARLAVYTHGLAADRWQAVRSRAAALEASLLIEALRSLQSD